MKSVDQGSATSIYVALTPGLEKDSGRFFSDCDTASPPNPLAYSDVLAKVLWEQSEQMTGSGPVLPGAEEKGPAPAAAAVVAVTPAATAAPAAATASAPVSDSSSGQQVVVPPSASTAASSGTGTAAPV